MRGTYRREFFARALVVSAALGACNAVIEPPCERCADLQIRTELDVFGPLDTIAFTLTNRSSESLRYDWCSAAPVRRTADTEPLFRPEYLITRRCGPGADLADVVANIRVLAPGTALHDSVSVGIAPLQGEYRLHVWLVDADGYRLHGNPVVSNAFLVFNHPEK